LDPDDGTDHAAVDIAVADLQVSEDMTRGLVDPDVECTGSSAGMNQKSPPTGTAIGTRLVRGSKR
jgi:hypothetical protein